MTDSSDERAHASDGSGDGDTPATDGDRDSGDGQTTERDVAEKYDFENFGPRQMEEMTVEEWETAFDPDSWVTGTELLDRVERDLTARIARRDVFAVVERDDIPGGERLVAYSDAGYAVVYEDGGVEGRGTVVRDVKPSVALCSMPDYEVPDADEGALPDPDAVEEETGQLGNRVLQAVAAVQLVVGAVLVATPLAADPLLGVLCTPTDGAYTCSVAGTTATVDPLGGSVLVAVVVGLAFLAFGGFLLVVVANARLSDRFRAEQYRERLREAGVESGERPEFVPGPEEPLEAPDGESESAEDPA